MGEFAGIKRFVGAIDTDCPGECAVFENADAACAVAQDVYLSVEDPSGIGFCEELNAYQSCEDTVSWALELPECVLAWIEPPNGCPEPLVDIAPGIKAKPEVRIDSLHPKLKSKFQTVFTAFQKYGYADLESNPVVITSGNDYDRHRRGSYHYKNRAIDIRGKHVPDRVLTKIATYLQRILGSRYAVWAEIFNAANRDRDHIHIEYRGA